MSKSTPGRALGNKIIAIVGPTASGKSSLGIFLAQKLDGEIISADSRQVYKGLDIGTGKVAKKEMAGIPHHLLDVASPKPVLSGKQFSADDFLRLGQRALSGILQNSRIPIIVGGTGLYVDVLLGRVVFPHIPPNPKLRVQLEKKSTEKLFAMLQKLDPERAKNIDPKNPRRLVRAIEIAKYRTSNVKPRSDASRLYDTLFLGINPVSEKLRKNIHARLIARIKSGMIREAKRLHAGGLSYKRMEELGLEYRYLAQLIQNKITKREFESQLEQAIWKYAKRQRTWFKRNKDVKWIKTNTEALRLAKKFLA